MVNKTACTLSPSRMEWRAPPAPSSELLSIYDYGIDGIKHQNALAFIINIVNLIMPSSFAARSGKQNRKNWDRPSVMACTYKVSGNLYQVTLDIAQDLLSHSLFVRLILWIEERDSDQKVLLAE